MNTLFDFKKSTSTVVVWTILLTMPLWIGHVDGYTDLGTRVLVIGLASQRSHRNH